MIDESDESRGFEMRTKSLKLLFQLGQLGFDLGEARVFVGKIGQSLENFAGFDFGGFLVA